MPPNQPTSTERKEESSPTSAQANDASTAEDVKMKEAKPEESWSDIPEHVLKVRLLARAV